MYNINQAEPFSKLKEFYIPANHSTEIVGKRKKFKLSIPWQGLNIPIKQSSKKIIHASLAKVIQGTVLRMKKLFEPAPLNLGVIINHRFDPKAGETLLEFELVNRNGFNIGNDEYFISIVTRYSYSKPETAVYLPILYRKWCSNGAVWVTSDRFKEEIHVDKILDIGCEWTKCNFEAFHKNANTYFEILKNNRKIESHIEELFLEAERLIATVLKPEKGRKNTRGDRALFNRDVSISQTVKKYLERDGNNQFAIFNVLTDFASNEPDTTIRYNYFIKIGKYLSREINKVTKNSAETWSEQLDWPSLNGKILGR
jgi:hypothetical protein